MNRLLSPLSSPGLWLGPALCIALAGCASDPKDGTETRTNTVTNTNTNTVTNTVTETVTVEPNLAPEANAGFDLSVPLGDPANLDGSLSSDPNGDVLTYEWRLVSTPPDSTAAALDDPSLPNPVLTTDVIGEYAVQLTVSDAEFTSAPDEVVVSVQAPPGPLLVVATSPEDGAQQADPDADILVGFSAPVDDLTVDATTFLVEDLSTGTATPVPGSLTVSGGLVVFDPTDPLPADGSFQVTLDETIQRLGAVPPDGTLGTDQVFSFDTAGPSVFEVDSVLPADGAVDVDLFADLVIAFSREVDEPSLTTDIGVGATDGLEPNVFVNPGTVSDVAQALPATVSWDPATLTATIDPDANLLFGQDYAITVTSDVFAPDGSRIPLTETWTFTTTFGDIIETIDPADGQQDVPVSFEPVVTFNDYVDPTTIHERSLFLTATGASGDTVWVPVVHTLEDTTADGDPTTFDQVRVTPLWDSVDCHPGDLPLRYGTDHELHLTSQLALLSGQTLTGGVVVGFTTGDDPRVDAIESDNGWVAYTDLDGQDEVPVNSTFTVSFADDMDPATVDESTIRLEDVALGGAVPATVSFDPATGVALLEPTDLLAFGSDYDLVVQGVDGSGLPGILDAEGEPLLGSPTRRFTTSPANSFEFVPLPSNSARPMNHLLGAVFDRPLDPGSVADSTLTLVDNGGATWTGVYAYSDQSRSVTITPVPLPSGETLTLEVTADVRDYLGNPFPQPTLGDFAFDAGSSDTNPSFVGSTPANGASGIAADEPYRMSFGDEVVLASSFTDATVLVECGGVPIPGHFDVVATSFTASYAEFVADDYWPGGQTCTVTITGGVSDLSRGNLYIYGYNSVRTFTVESVAPTQVSIVPADGSTTAGWDTAITIGFSEPILPASAVLGTSVFLTDTATGNPVPAQLDVSGDTLTLVPDAFLDAGVTYEVDLGVGLTDLAGNPLSLAGVDTFPTTFTVESTPPLLTSVSPAMAAVDVPVADPVVLSFDEPMDPATLVASDAFGGGSIFLDAVCDSMVELRTCPSLDATGTVLTLTPTRDPVPGDALPANTAIDIDLDLAVVSDAAGNLLDPNGLLPSTFTTADGLPEALCVSPAHDTTGVGLSDPIVLGFTEDMDPAATEAAFRLTSGFDGSAVPVGFTWLDGRTLEVLPLNPLDPYTTYWVEVDGSAVDLAGDPLLLDWVSSFQTL